MGRRNWKRIQPASFSHAMELCLLHAKERHNRSVDQVADLMGLANKWVIYKWVESGKLPGILIRPFEHACGIDYVTRYIAHSNHKLLIDIPTGRAVTENDIHELQSHFNDALGLLLKFRHGDQNTDETIAAITTVLQDLAWHRGNVEKSAQPELDFEEDGI